MLQGILCMGLQAHLPGQAMGLFLKPNVSPLPCSPLYQHVLFQKHTKNHFYFLILAPKQYFKTKNMQSRMQKQRFFFPEQSVREFLQTVAAVLSCFACFVASTVNLFETELAVWVIFGWVKA